MPKFSNGEFALLQGANSPSDPWILNYNGTIVEVVHFVGHKSGSSKTDWYLISLEDDKKVYARETVLHKLPDEYSPGEMSYIESLMNTKRKEATCE